MKEQKKNSIIVSVSMTIMLCMYLVVNSQVGVQIVNDPTNLAKIKEIVQTGQDQLQKIKDQTAMLEDAKQVLIKVNRNISKANTVKNAISQQQRIINHFSETLLNVDKDVLSPEAAQAYLSRIENYRVQVLDNNSRLLDLVSDNIYQMTDYERMKAIDETIQSNEKVLANAEKEKKRYEELNKQLKTLNNLSWKTIK